MSTPLLVSYEPLSEDPEGPGVVSFATPPGAAVVAVALHSAPGALALSGPVDDLLEVLQAALRAVAESRPCPDCGAPAGTPCPWPCSSHQETTPYR